jgi:hypothetical protein
MNKLAIIPIFFLTMCGTAPVTDPPAHACSPRLDGKPTYCPEPDAVCQAIECDKRDLILLPREEARGEIDITSPYHLQSLQMMFQRNMRKGEIERNATTPSDAINNALMEFNNGSNDPTKSEELLQLPSDRDQPSG